MHRTPLLGFFILVVITAGSSCSVPRDDRRGALEADGGDDPSASEPERDAGPEPLGVAPDAGRPDKADGAAPDDAATPSDGPSDSDAPRMDPSSGPQQPEPSNSDPAAQRGADSPPGASAFDTYGITSHNRLIRFERATGKIARGTSIRGLRDGERILGGDIRPANGQLYALSDAARLYQIDLETAMATVVAALAPDANDTSEPYKSLRGERFGVDFNPVADRLRVVSDTGDNLRIDVTTGSTTTDTAIGSGAGTLTAAAYTQSFAAACRTRLLVIDSKAKRLLLQDPPNAGVVSEIGSLADAAFDEVTSFEIETAADGVDRGFIATSTPNGVRLFDLDLRTGAATKGRALALDSGETLTALTAARPTSTPAQNPGELLALTASQRLISFNRGAPGKLCTSTSITGVDAGDGLLGFDVRPSDGKLYALAKSGKLFTISVPSAESSLVATLMPDEADTTDRFSALRGSEFGIGFNPVADRLRVISDAGQNLRINVTTGATTTDTTLDSATRVSALAYTNAFFGTKSTTLFALDRSQAALIRVGGDPATTGACTPEPETTNPNCGVTQWIGDLDVGAGTSIGGFEIDSKSATAFAALTNGRATVSTLYTIDLVRGSAMLPAGIANATIGGGEVIQSLTLAAAPTARAFALTSDAKLLTFSPNAPSTPSTIVTITGLQPSERLLGIDLRPADGKLYAPSTSNRLYTLDPKTGAASLVATLAAAGGDDQPFTGFTATAHGVDFNPAADLLRVVDTNLQNDRIVPSARNDLKPGDVFSDTPLRPGTPAIVGAAYSDNYAGSPWTTLYTIDADSDVLFLQGGTQGTPSPNGGTLTPIGKLGIDVTGEVGFDIVGGHNGLAIAAVQTSATLSELYSVNLSAGWLTPFNPQNNTIGGEGIGPIVGLALELK
jgi:Domain of unknown function (DUF4394)